MSRSNIVSITGGGEGVGAAALGVLGPEGALVGELLGEETSIIVTFRVHQGTMSYRYTGNAATAILAGDDPANYEGERIS
jgi:hypothetical protein